MKVETVKFNDYSRNNKNKISRQNTKINRQLYTAPLRRSIPPSYVRINFCGRPPESLWDEYNWYIRNDRTPAIYSFLKIKEAPETMDKFFTAILNSAERSRELISSIVYNPRGAVEITENLKKVLPQNSKNLMPFFFDSPYNTAYKEFTDWKIKESRSIEDLLRMRPDWREDVLLKKYQELKPNDGFKIGNIPRELPRTHLKQIVEYLGTQMEYGIKTKKDIPELRLDNRTYNFAYFTEGKSDKNVFGIYTPEGKKFVLKMSHPEMRSLENPFALGTLAKIDSYLTYNRSRNSAPLCYYNHNKNFSIYKYIEHVPAPAADMLNLSDVLANIPDFSALGLTYNDTVGEKNFFLMDLSSNEDLKHAVGFQEGLLKHEWISVDNDHVTYGCRLQPPIEKYHKPLPVGMQMFN